VKTVRLSCGAMRLSSEGLWCRQQKAEAPGHEVMAAPAPLPMTTMQEQRQGGAVLSQGTPCSVVALGAAKELGALAEPEMRSNMQSCKSEASGCRTR
jgi:hypothetical protein